MSGNALPWSDENVICRICHKPHLLTDVRNRYNLVFCMTYSWWYHGWMYTVDSRYCERRQIEEQEHAWELLAESLTPAPEYEDQPIFKVRCSKCGGWFDSDYNAPGHCWQCVTVKEVL